MKTSMYFNYTARALLRGGQRTILAICCVAVGVMAVVSLQLVGLMLQNSLTANVRETNGGNIAVTTPGVPLKPGDLTLFDQLKRAETISNYTAVISATGGLNSTATSIQSFSVEAVDPNNYPLVSQPAFVEPSGGTVAHLLVNDQVLVTQNFLDRYQKQLGDTFNLYIKTSMGLGQALPVKIAGVIANSGMFAQSGNLLLISKQDYLATAPTALAEYSLVDITTADQAHTDTAVKAITAQFPLASTQTVADVLKNQQASIALVNKFLEIAGLLALLIGGVGIVNTMQVLLSRRKIEIAMLKTTGYRRLDLYLLFGLEAGLLGLAGGVVGAAAATGVSLLVRNLVQQTFSINIPFVLDPLTIGGGVLIGLVTALIFGLMPIVQAANIRPLNVIRELPEGNRAGSIGLTVLLLVILSVLFCVLAIVILNDVLLGIGAVYGAFIFLLLLSLFFGLVVFVISIMPVPERITPGFLAWIVAGLVLSVLLYLVLPTFGAILLGLSLFGFVVAFLPRSWKSSTKIALRNIGRQRARTTTTMLALL